MSSINENAVVVVFISGDLPDLQSLLDGVKAGSEVYMLDGRSDELSQMEKLLAGRTGFDAIHILSHGSEGQLLLGTTTLTSDNLHDYSATLTRIGSSLAVNGDLLLYGCDVAAGNTGHGFIGELSTITGADVAASDDLTGAASLGGDWVLEAQSGAVEATSMMMSAYSEVLAVTSTVTVTTGPSAAQLPFAERKVNVGFMNSLIDFGIQNAIAYFADDYTHYVTRQVSVDRDMIGIDLLLVYMQNFAFTSAQTEMFRTLLTAGGRIFFIGNEYNKYTSFSVDDSISEVIRALGGNISVVHSDVSLDVLHDNGSDGIKELSNSPLMSGVTSFKTVYFSPLSIDTAISKAVVVDDFSNVVIADQALLKGRVTVVADNNWLDYPYWSSVAGNKTFLHNLAADSAGMVDTIAAGGQPPPVEPIVNTAPMLTSFSAAVDSVAEDNAVELTLADLKAKADEFDDVSVDAFVIKAVTSGTLLLGTSSGSASDWVPGSNDVITGTINAYWTPAANVNGALNAFTVVARDNTGLVSATQVEVPVAVTPVNDNPILSDSVIISCISEDPAINGGSTVGALVTPVFSDVDTGNTPGGIVITGNSATTEGKWEYSVDGTHWFDVGTSVSESGGLALSATTKLHFAPALNWNGVPPALTFHATDSAFTGYTAVNGTDAALEGSRVTFNASTASASSGISVATKTVLITVNAVNNAPAFTSTAGAPTMTETSAYDSALRASSGSLTGTLTAADVDSTLTGTAAFGVRGGSVSGNTVTKVGLYGTLTLDSRTGIWSYVPGNLVAINALAAGTTVFDRFDFKVVDSLGAFSIQALDITINGANDTPLIAVTIADQSFSGSGSWSYQIPAGSFTDAEGTGLTYTVQVVNGVGALVGNGTLATNASWLSFDEASRTFSGNPTAVWNDASLNLKVTVTDAEGATASDTFTLTLSGTANQSPVVANPLTWKAFNAPSEVTTVSFTQGTSGQTITFAGTTVTLNKTTPANEVTAAVLSSSFSNWSDTSVDADTVRFTAKATGNKTDVVAANWGGSFSGGVTIAKVQDGGAGVTGAHESFVLTLADNDAQARTLIFQGVTHAIAASATADAIATALNGDVFGNWTAARTVAGQVTFTNTADGNQTNITTADFTGSYMPMVASPTVLESSVSNFLFQVVAIDSVARTFVLDGASMTITANQTAAQVAAQIAAHGAFGKWNTAVVVNSTQVRFTDTDVTAVPATTNTLISQTFDTAAAFTDNFTQSSPATGTFTWGSNAGLGAGAGVSISDGSDQVWTTRQSYTVTSNGVYTVSAFFKSVLNSGYGAIGFSLASQDSNAGGSGAPAGTNMGAYFHGGGGGFLNNGVISSVNWSTNPLWSGDPVAPGHWYKFVFTLTAKGGGSYGLNLKIYNAADNGTLGAMFSEITTTVTNATVAAAESLRVFFSGEGSRMSAMDNFVIDLQNSTAIGTQTGGVVSTPDVSGTYLSIDGHPSVGSVVDGTATVVGKSEIFDATFGAGASGSTLTFDGATVTVPATTLTAAEVAARVAGSSYAGYTGVDNGNGAVTFTATTPGDKTDLTSGNFTGTYTGTATPTVNTQGAGWSYTIPAGTFTDPENDTLTYSAYTVTTNGSGVQRATPIGNAGGALSFDPVTHILSGNGTAPGNTIIEIRATDAAGSAGTASSQFQLVVYNDSITVAVSAVMGAIPSTVSFVTGSGAGACTVPAGAFNIQDTPGTSITYSATLSNGGALPGWLSFNTITGAFTGNPPNGVTSIGVKVTATDSGSHTATSAAFTLAISSPNDPIVLTTPASDQTASSGGSISYYFNKPFTDPDGSVTGTATTAGITYTATANGHPLSDYALAITADPSGHAGQVLIDGNAPAGVPSLDLIVTGTETNGGTTATTSFKIDLGGGSASVGGQSGTFGGALGANNPGTVAFGGTPTQGQALTANAPVDADGYTASSQTCQWQVSSDNSAWLDIAGSRGQASTLTLAQSESGKYVRVQAFYVDNGGVAEAPVSSGVSVANMPDAGTVTIMGSTAPGYALSATISDPDGLVNAAPTYKWQVSDNGSNGWSDIIGATYSAYTLANADGGKYVRVVTGYTDDGGYAETNVTSAATTMIALGAIAPVAGDDTATVTENSGTDNTTVPSSFASPITGNLVANDTDGNSGDSQTVTGLRQGELEGIGLPAIDNGTTLTRQGLYGTLVVNKATGTYTYTLDQNSADVQRLNTGSTPLTESFNYMVTDSSLLSDTAVLTITINGANDFAFVASGIEAAATVSEDLATALPVAFLQLADWDSATIILRLTVDHGTLRAITSGGVTIAGSDSATMTLTESDAGTLSAWLLEHPVLYVTGPNAMGAVATLSYAVSDGAGFVTAPGTTVITATAVNDAPIVDAGGAATAGNDFITLFRPRGAAVTLAPNLTISDIDSTELSSATVTLAAGARDNLFGTLSETLILSSAGQSALAAAGLTATATQDATGALLTISGTASATLYQAVLREILYNNANQNAIAGDRTVTIALTDSSNQVSNAASVAIASANLLIAVGQRIFIDGVDSGETVATVLDTQHFVASGPLTSLSNGSGLSFYDAAHQPVGTATTTAIQAGPLVATVTMQVPWTPVVDMNGNSVAGRDWAVTWKEGALPIALATNDASLTAQGGMIRSITATLTGMVDMDNQGTPASQESLLISSALQTTLASKGISTVFSESSHTITFTAAGAGADASNFQIALRGVQYSNSSQNPVTSDRLLTVTTLGVDGNTGVSAATAISVVAINDAPEGIDSAVLTTEDSSLYTFTVSDFGFSDPLDASDGSANTLMAVTITALPGIGTLQFKGVAVTAGQTIAVADIAGNKLAYVPAGDSSGIPTTTFTFQVQDNGGTVNSGVDLDPTPATMTINITPVNDAPVLTGLTSSATTIDENATTNSGQAVSTLLGTHSDVDSGAHGANNGTLTGMAVYSASNGGQIGGHWEFSINGGSNWARIASATDFALLLRSTDLIRFVPDTIGGTTSGSLTLPTLDYYLWDQATGTAGDEVSSIESARGGITSLSTASGTVSIVVTDVNDAPTVAITGKTIFNPRGFAAALFADASASNSSLVLNDVDNGDYLVSATLVMDLNATLDNDFGTTNETLSTTLAGGVYHGTMGDITFTGNGSGAGLLINATSLTLTGHGTAADYKAALQTVQYNNTNPNAYAGLRPITLTVHDAALITSGAGATDSIAATVKVSVDWAPVADLNDGVVEVAGRDYTVSYTENTSGAAIAASAASLTDEDGNIKSVMVTLTNPQDETGGVIEKLFITDLQITALNSIGLAVSGNNSHAITLGLASGVSDTGLDGTYFQLGLRMIQYTNTSQNPNLTPRLVTVSSVDMQDHAGVGATTTITPVRVNDAPTGVVTIANSDRALNLLQQGDQLSVTNTLGDPDGMTPSTVTYQWKRAGSAVSGSTASTYMLTQDDVGNVMTVEATYTDDGGTTEQVTSASTIAVINVNDRPVAMADANATTENVNLTIDASNGVLANDTDLDPLDTHTVSTVAGQTSNVAVAVNGNNGGAFTLAADGSWTFNPGTAFDYLAAGEVQTTSVLYTNKDNSGIIATDTSLSVTLMVTVTGVNDQPTITVVDGTGAVTEDITVADNPNTVVVETTGAWLVDSGSVTFAEVDDTDILSSVVALYGTPVASTGATVSGALATALADAGTLKLSQTGTNDGAIVWSFALDNTLSQYLAKDESVTATYRITLTDDSGAANASRTQDVTVTLTGVNDTPVVTNESGQLAGSATEAGHLDDGQTVLSGMGINGLTHVTGMLTASDVDHNATRTWSIQGTPSVTYGTMTINPATGLWDYALNNYLPATQSLQEGEVVTETFIARVTDDFGAFVDQTVSITITGTNDVPVVDNDASAREGVVTEAGNFDNGTIVSGISTASAPLSASDVDRDATRLWSLAGKTATTYGVMNIDSSTGKWRYTIDNTLAATQSLREGDVATQTYIARVTDDKGAWVDQTITISINGTNDSPVAVADTNTTSENVMLTVNAANGLLANDTDPDTGSTHRVNAVDGLPGNVGAAAAGTNGGLFTVAVDGSYSFNPGSTTFDYLAAGETTATRVNYTVIDDKGAANSSTVTVTLTGTNDDPIVASSDLSGAVIETIGTPAALATLMDTGTIAFSDVDLTDIHSLSAVTASTGVLGLLTVTKSKDTTGTGTDGMITWNYSVGASVVEYLAAGQTRDETFTFTVGDGHGGTIERTVTVTLTGTNDLPSIVSASTTASGAFTEAALTTGSATVHTVSGSIAFSDADLTDTHVITVTGADFVRSSGTLTQSQRDALLAAFHLDIKEESTSRGVGTQAWHFSAADSIFDYLANNETLVAAYTVTVDDIHTGGTVTKDVVITITGTNDAAIITGTSTVNLTETNAVLTATGTLSANDVDSDSSFVSQTDLAGTNGYGKFSIGSNGVWNYTAYSAHNEFVGGTNYTDSVTVATADGTGQVVTVTIVGINGDAPVISGTFSGGVTEITGTPAAQSMLTSTGTMEFSDADVADTHTLGAVTASTGVLGTLTITKTADTAGVGTGGKLTWNYSVDAGAVEYLAAGETKDERFTFTLSDDQGSTTERAVTVTLTGTNDALAIVSGSSTASSTFFEAPGSTGSAELDIVSSSIAFADADVRDTHVVTVTGTRFVWSNGNLTQPQKEALAAAFHPGTMVDSTGTGNGTQAWSFSAADATFDFLAKDDTLTATYTVTVADGHGSSAYQDVVVSIEGTNDAAVITGTSMVSLIETNSVLTASGALSVTDVDGPALFVAQANVAGNHGYGKFSIGTDGVWSYTADTAHKEFTGGANYTDSITVAAADGTRQVIAVTITGINDAALITGTSTASLTEAKTALAATGTLSATDIDSAATFVAQTNVAGSNGYGHFSVGTNGVWNYTTDSANGEFVTGTNYTDSFIVTTADGTPQLVSVTIAGSNSGAVITGTSTASLIETDAVLTATGVLVATDLDSPMTFVARTNVAGNHAYGKFSIGAYGVWSYTADNAHNEFAGGTDYTDSFMVSTADGTEQVVTVTIAGTNDVAVISGTRTASLTQTSVPLTATGQLSATDVDSAITFVARTSVVGSNGYGHFSVGVDGVWSYTADSAHCELSGGVDYSDSFTVSTADGTQQLVSVTITGIDDPAVLSSVISTLPETSTLRSTGGKLAIRDIDTPLPTFTAQEGTHGTNGTFVLGADGVWSYTFDPEIVFTAGASYSDVFNVFSADGTATTVSVYKTSGPISLGSDSAGVSLVDLTVPVGITFSEAHSPESTLATLRDQLVTGASESKISAEMLNDGIDAYMLTLQDQQQVTVRNITFSNDSAGTTASSDPIIITGASGKGEGSTANPNHQEALVVDATNLPSGSVINFNNVEFAIVIGAVRLMGGEGKNYVIGDDFAQWIVLGAEDDTLYGGGGDDVIGSHGGNDLLYGDAGDDTLSGGIENDTLCGGSGDDLLYGDESTTGGDGVDTALYTDALAGVTVSLLTGTADDGIPYTTKQSVTRAGHDTLYDIENIVAGDFDDTIIGNDFANKLEGGKGNDTLTGGKGNDTLNGGTGKLGGTVDSDRAVFSGKVADYTISYDAATHSWTLVDTIAGRDGTDTVTNVEIFQFDDSYQFQGADGDATLTGGAGTDTVTYITAHAAITVDLRNRTASSTPGGDAGIGTDTLISIENVIGGDFADSLTGSSANNKLAGGKGNDTIDGGAGVDTVVFSGNYADYTISYDEATHLYTIVDKMGGRDGTDVISYVENFQFADVTRQDIIRPTLETSSPGSGTTGAGVGNDVVLTFSEAIHRGTGTIAICSASGAVVASSDDATSATIATAGNTLTINPTHDLAYSTHYYVTLADGSIHDLAENSFAGTTTFDFTTGADPYIGANQGGSGVGTAILGLGTLGVLAWVVF